MLKARHTVHLPEVKHIQECSQVTSRDGQVQVGGSGSSLGVERKCWANFAKFLTLINSRFWGIKYIIGVGCSCTVAQIPLISLDNLLEDL